jgi:hypothetical protein
MSIKARAVSACKHWFDVIILLSFLFRFSAFYILLMASSSVNNIKSRRRRLQLKFNPRSFNAVLTLPALQIHPSCRRNKPYMSEISACSCHALWCVATDWLADNGRGQLSHVVTFYSCIKMVGKCVRKCCNDNDCVAIALQRTFAARPDCKHVHCPRRQELDERCSWQQRRFSSMSRACRSLSNGGPCSHCHLTTVRTSPWHPGPSSFSFLLSTSLWPLCAGSILSFKG